MSEPSQGLSVRMCERKNDGPSAKMMHKNRNISAHSVSYTIQATPGVEFGIIIKVKEDFDFKGSEGLRITITVSDDGWRDNGPTLATSSQEQSWYVDALSKWSGRQVFHAFDNAATTATSPAPKQEFTMPHPSPNSDSSHYSAWLVSVMDSSPVGCITVRVERGNLIDGALPSHTYKKSDPGQFRRMQKRSTKQHIESAQFEVLAGVQGLAAVYEFRNTGVIAAEDPITAKDVALTSNSAEMLRPSPFKVKAQPELSLAATSIKPLKKMVCNASLAPKDPKKNIRTRASHLWKDSDQIGEYRRCSEELDRYVEDMIVVRKAYNAERLREENSNLREAQKNFSNGRDEPLKANEEMASQRSPELSSSSCIIHSLRRSCIGNHETTQDPLIVQKGVLECHNNIDQDQQPPIVQMGALDRYHNIDADSVSNGPPSSAAPRSINKTRFRTSAAAHSINTTRFRMTDEERKFVDNMSEKNEAVKDSPDSGEVASKSEVDLIKLKEESLVEENHKQKGSECENSADSSDAASESQTVRTKHTEEEMVEEKHKQESSECGDEVMSIDFGVIDINGRIKEDEDYVLVDEDKSQSSGCVCS